MVKRLRNFLPSFLKYTKSSSQDSSNSTTSSTHPTLLKISEFINMPLSEEKFFVEAFTLKKKDTTFSYERLEFLGDAILGAIISEKIFSLYPSQDEGFLTQLKSKIVNRKSLNTIGAKHKLRSFIINPSRSALSPDIDGNLVESLIGAIYLSNGYQATCHFIETILIPEHQILQMEHIVVSYKSVLMEWAQKNNKELHFQTGVADHADPSQNYKAEIIIGTKVISWATDISKKKAEEKASKRAFYQLNPSKKIKENAFPNHRG